MLVRIKPEDVEIGMFVHAFEGSWFDHPFWRSNFRIETPDQLHRIRQSAIAGLVIDQSRGRAAPVPRPVVEDRPTRRAAVRKASARPLFQPPVPVAAPPPPPRDALRLRRGYAVECRRARRIIDKSRQAVADMFDAARLGKAIEARRMVPLARAIGESITRDGHAMINLVRLKDKDEYSYLHSVAVCALMINFARHLELDEREVLDLGVAGLLHDVGKVAVSDEILNKNGSLSDIERRSVELHPAAGHQLLADSDNVPEAALEVCLHHHEKVDGAGYPHGLSGEALTLIARMGAICDVYDALTSNRPYKDAWTPCEALTEMQGWTGHFDARLLEQFGDALGLYPVGTLVRLSTGELGVVAGNDGEAAENVVVRVFFDCETLIECEPFDRVIGPAAENPRIVSRDSPTFWRFPDWDAMRYRILAAKVEPAPVDPAA